MSKEIVSFNLVVRGTHLGLEIKCNRHTGKLMEKNDKELDGVIVAIEKLADKLYEEISEDVCKKMTEEVKELKEDENVSEDLKEMLVDEDFLDFVENFVKTLRDEKDR